MVKKPQREIYSRRAIMALIMAYIVLSTAYSLTEKLRYGPDEPAHFIYVREIGGHARFPELSHVETHDISLHSSHEAHQPPLYYMLAAVPYAVANAMGAGIDTIWRIIRFFTVLIGAAWIYFLYRLAREFFGRRRYAAVLAAACVGLLPMSVYIGGVVNNDVLMCLTFTAALWLILKCLRRGQMRWRDSITIGVVAGLAVLTKAQGLFLLPIIGLAALFVARRRNWKTIRPAIGFVAAVVIAAIISSPWFIYNQVVYGMPITQSLYNPIPGTIGIFGLSFITDQLFKFFWIPYWLVPSFVRDPNTYSPRLAMLYTRGLLALCFMVLAGVIAYLYKHRRNGVGDLSCRVDAWSLLALPGVLIYLFLIRHTVQVDRGALQQGRLLLPAAGVFGIGLITAGMYAMTNPRIRVILGLLLIAGLIVANLMMLRSISLYHHIWSG